MPPKSSSTNRSLPEGTPTFWTLVLSSVFLMGYFTLLPIILVILLNWAAHAILADSFFSELWVAPTLLLLATFLGGALMRQKIEDETGGMRLFVVGIIALILFALLTYQDIHAIGGVYSRFMPKFLSVTIGPYIYMLPAVGILGMLAYKHFTLKHYS